MVIQAALNKALKLELIKKNPDRYVELQKPKRYVAGVYNQEEIRQLLEYSKDTDMFLPVSILVSLGLRRAELVGLKWEDINWSKSQITIERTLAIKDSKLIEKSPKTESSTRTIDIPKELLELLKNEQENYNKRKEEQGKNFWNSGYIVAHPNGKPFRPDYMSAKFRKIIDKSGLKKIRLHDLRHTNATLMLTLGISPKVAQARLGHSNFSITMDTYSHILEEIDKEAAEKIGESIF